MMSNAAKSFNILITTNLSVLYNYFNNSTKLFSDLYLAKFFNALTKPFFPYKLNVSSHYISYEISIYLQRICKI